MFPYCPGRVETFLLAHPGKRNELKKKWAIYREEILSGWKKQNKKGQPWAARMFENE